MEMTLREIENSMYKAAYDKRKDTLRELVGELQGRLIKMDRWFDMFLDKFDEKLSDVELSREDPVKKLYNSKFDEYSRTKQLKIVAESYMKNV